MMIIELILTSLVAWTHFVCVFSNPGFEEEIFLAAHDQEQDQTHHIKEATDIFHKKKNSLDKFLLISGY